MDIAFEFGRPDPQSQPIVEKLDKGVQECQGSWLLR